MKLFHFIIVLFFAIGMASDLPPTFWKPVISAKLLGYINKTLEVEPQPGKESSYGSEIVKFTIIFWCVFLFLFSTLYLLQRMYKEKCSKRAGRYFAFFSKSLFLIDCLTKIYFFQCI